MSNTDGSKPSTIDFKEVSKSSCQTGSYCKYQHYSKTCQSTMKFSVFAPKNPNQDKLPALFFLSGLTCTEDNFIQKACAIKKASQLGVFLICPDTSPRETGIEGEDDEWDLGSGASFYVNATEPRWKKHYQMYSYVVDELPSLIFEKFCVDPTRVSIFGHSMGGHGALVVGIRNPDKFKSCSAFAPNCNPSVSEMSKKAFTEYLGSNVSDWHKYDATELIKEHGGASPIPILITQGSEDSFYTKGELVHNNFLKQVGASGDKQEVIYNLEQGFDHSYWFIQTFVEDHLEFHARHLKLI